MAEINLIVPDPEVTDDFNNLLFLAIVLNGISNINPFHNETLYGLSNISRIAKA